MGTHAFCARPHSRRVRLVFFAHAGAVLHFGQTGFLCVLFRTTNDIARSIIGTKKCVCVRIRVMLHILYTIVAASTHQLRSARIGHRQRTDAEFTDYKFEMTLNRSRSTYNCMCGGQSRASNIQLMCCEHIMWSGSS